jgi:hypothetical protein
MACPCCSPQISCATECNGNGVPSQISMQITQVSFGANSEFDESDLEFAVPSTFILPLRDPDSGCTLWDASFFPRATLCSECGQTGFNPGIAGLAISVDRRVIPNQLNVVIVIRFGDVTVFGNCIGASGRFFATAIGSVCALPLSGTANVRRPGVGGCDSFNISSVAFTLEAA